MLLEMVHYFTAVVCRLYFRWLINVHDMLFLFQVDMLASTEGLSKRSLMTNLIRRMFSGDVIKKISWSGKKNTIAIKNTRIGELIYREYKTYSRLQFVQSRTTLVTIELDALNTGIAFNIAACVCMLM